MHGVIIVKPADGFPTDNEIDQEYVIVQNEWCQYNDLEDMTNGVPSQVVFSTKALHEGEPNTNGRVNVLKDMFLQAKEGDMIRIYINSVVTNVVSSFIVYGYIL